MIDRTKGGHIAEKALKIKHVSKKHFAIDYIFIFFKIYIFLNCYVHIQTKNTRQIK